jgi:enterochelin esterase family protein
MVFQDGAAYVHPEGQVRAPTVMDNLIHKGEMPVTIAVFVNPGILPAGESNRFTEYVANGNAYGRFLLDEIIPEVGKDHSLVEDPEGRAICGMSDGGLCAFAVAWERPDAFSKVVSHIASYVRIIDGEDFPTKIRQTRRDPKPLRVFLQDGKNDLNIEEGNWTISNLSMASALTYGRYDHRFELGDGGHDLGHGGKLFPDTLRWLWRDYPGVAGADAPPDYTTIAGRWQVEANAFGMISRSVLTIEVRDEALAATLEDEQEGALEVIAIRFDGHRLSYDYRTPPAQRKWGKTPSDTMTTWLSVDDGKLAGVVSGEIGPETSYDYAVKGQKVDDSAS